MEAVRFELITAAAITACLPWLDAAIYPWESVPNWKCKDPKGLDLAIWSGQKLCGLCYATPRKSTICIKIVLLQSHPDRSHPLRGLIAPMALLAADTYARIIGCNEIEIQEPDPNVVPYYQKLGFSFDKNNRLVIYLDDK